MSNKKTFRKYAVTTMAAATAAATVVPAAVSADTQAGFPDVSPDSDHYDAIMKLVESGAISGYEDGTFGPHDSIYRGQVAVILAKQLDLDVPEDIASVLEVYSDVDETHRYAEEIAAVTEANIFTGKDGKFDPYGDISRQQMATVLVKGLNLEDYNTDEDVEVNLDKVSDDHKDNVQILANLDITVQSYFDGYSDLSRGQFATFLVKSLEVVSSVDVEVESVSAINAKTLEVTFNKELELTKEEQEELEITAQRDGSNVLVEFDEINGDKATVVRTNGADFDAGTYSLNISGLAEEDLTGETTVSERAVDELVVGNENLLDETTRAKVGLEVKDQYGDNFEFDGSDVEAKAFNKTQNKDVAIEYDNDDETFFIDTYNLGEDEFEEGDKVIVTFVHRDTGESVSKELEVVAGAHLNSISLGDIQLPDDKTILTQDMEDVRVPYTALDQYGNEIELDKTDSYKGNISVIVTDETVIDEGAVTFEKNSDGETYINLEEFKETGKTNVVLVNKVTGETTTLALDVNEKAGVPYSVELAEGSVDIPAGNGQKVVDLIVEDKYGNKVEPKDYANEKDFTIVSSNESVAGASIQDKANQDHYGKLIVDSKTDKKDTTAKITVTINATGQSANLDVKIAEEAKPFDLQVSDGSKHASSIVETGSTTVKFNVFDQYDNKLADNDDYSVNYKLKDSGEEKLVSLSDKENGLENPKVTVTGLEAGSVTLVAELVKDTGEDEELVDTVEIPFTVVANSSENFTYEVEEIPELYKNGSADYEEAITVNALDKGGNKVELPDSSILHVESSDEGLVEVVKPSASESGTWSVVGAVNSDQGNNEDIDEDKTVTLTLSVRTDEGTKTIKQDVVVSAEELKTQELALMNKAAGEKDAEAVETIEVDDYEGTITFNSADQDGFIWATDQFGVTTNFDVNDGATVAASTYDGIQYTSDDTYKPTAVDTITVTDVNGDTVVEENSSYRLTIVDGEAALDIPVKVTNAKTVAPKVESAITENIEPEAQTTITFSKAIHEDSKGLIETVIRLADNDNEDLTFTWNQEDTELTVTNNGESATEFTGKHTAIFKDLDGKEVNESQDGQNLTGNGVLIDIAE